VPGGSLKNRRSLWYDLSEQGKWDAMHNDQRKLDIVERLRVAGDSLDPDRAIEAANEIERLRYMIQALQGCTDDPPEDTVPG